MRLFLTVIIFALYITSSKSIQSKKVDVTKRNKLIDSELNYCDKCKIFTESFSYWLDKTSRGKFEGGDAAWEEAKLRSYARSEIRLVEIQEGLCSDVKKNKDDCYKLLEDAEQPLEDWWFNQEPNSDFFTWLCIDTMHHCCPNKHYGLNCDPCLLDKNNIVCSGHGECNGDGTRSGNGSCICYNGYEGLTCHTCSVDFFKTDSSTCEPCHKSCAGCNGPEAADCVSCKDGWRLDSGQCRDVDECKSNNVCMSGTYCLNNQGSFKCKSCDIACKTCFGSGPTNCNSCAHGFEQWGDKCIEKTFRESIISIAHSKLALYLGLIIISYFVLRKSRLLASIVIIVVSYYIYISENSLQVKTSDVIYYTYFYS